MISSLIERLFPTDVKEYLIAREEEETFLSDLAEANRRSSIISQVSHKYPDLWKSFAGRHILLEKRGRDYVLLSFGSQRKAWKYWGKSSQNGMSSPWYELREDEIQMGPFIGRVA